MGQIHRPALMSGVRMIKGAAVRIAENGSDVVLDRAEIEMVLRHLREFEELTNVLLRESEKGESEKGVVADRAGGESDYAVAVGRLRRFLEAEEAPEARSDRAVDGVYCCK